MKVVKLNRRFRQFKEHGHTIALRFEHGFTDDARRIERASHRVLRCGGWQRDEAWYSYYGVRSGQYGTRPYWITFRNEQDLTMVLLTVESVA